MAHSKPPRPGPRHAGGKSPGGQSPDGRSEHNARPPRRVRLGEIPPRAPGFAGRAEAARALAATLTPGSSVLLTPASEFAAGPRNWLGASGKTQLAAWAASSLWRSGAVDLLVWITATDQAAVLAAYAEAAAAATGIDPPGAAAGRFVSWLATTGQPWLVVLDDVPDADALGGLWPSGPSGRVLITTSTSPALRDRDAKVIPVGMYTVREALGCLTERLSEAPEQRQGAIDLIETAGREPLALAQACAVMVSSGMTCLEYRDYLVRRGQQLRVVPGEARAAAAATWTLSLDHAETLLPGQLIRHTLMLAALLDGHGIPGEVFGTSAVAGYLGRPGSARAEALTALTILEQAGLVTLDETPPGDFLAEPVVPTVRMSLAVQGAIQVAAPARFADRAATVAADALLELWPASEPHAWTAAALRANVESLWQAASAALLSDGCHPVLIRAGCSLDDAGLTGPAATFWLRLAPAAAEAGHPDAAAVSSRLAAALLADGRGAEAADWYRRVLAERVRVLVQGSAAITEARVSLGRALLAAGQHTEAVTALSEAALEAERVLGAGSAGTLAAQDALATAYLASGRAEDAVDLLQRALAERERVAGARDPGTITARERLAGALLAAGDGRAAQAHTGRVLADREAVLGKTHPDAIAARAMHAAAVHAAGRRPAALQLIERACADSAAVLGPDHPDTLARRVSLAHVYYSVGRVGDAASVLRDTQTRASRALAADDPLAATITQSLLNITGGGGG